VQRELNLSTNKKVYNYFKIVLFMKSLKKIVSGLLILSSLVAPQKINCQTTGIYIPKYVFIYLDENNEIEDVKKNNSKNIFDLDQNIVIINEQGEIFPCPYEIKHKLNKFNYQRNNQLSEIEKEIADNICRKIDCPLKNIEDILASSKTPKDLLEKPYQIKVNIDTDKNCKTIKEIKYYLNIQ